MGLEELTCNQPFRETAQGINERLYLYASYVEFCRYRLRFKTTSSLGN